MEAVQLIGGWFADHWGTIATGLFLISEALASIPSVQANSVFQSVTNYLKRYAPAK